LRSEEARNRYEQAQRDSALLNELGYFRPSLRFWTWESFPDSMKVAEKIEARIKAMNLTDTGSAKVLRRFQDARRERRAWWLGGTLCVLLVAWIAKKLFRWKLSRQCPETEPA
jgi:hypothetical protein